MLVLCWATVCDAEPTLTQHTSMYVFTRLPCVSWAVGLSWADPTGFCFTTCADILATCRSRRKRYMTGGTAPRQSSERQELFETNKTYVVVHLQ